MENKNAKKFNFKEFLVAKVDTITGSLIILAAAAIAVAIAFAIRG